MSIDIGTLMTARARSAERALGAGGTFDQGATSFDNDVTQWQAQALFDSSAEYAFSGGGTVSAETQSIPTGSAGLVDFATDYPDRFLSLVSHLTPILQDIFIQYYLLGRTYSQIGLTLFPRKNENSRCILVKTGNRLGLRALAALVACGSTVTLYGAYHQAWEEAIQWQSNNTHNRSHTIRAPRDLGSFVIVPNGQLRELFAPSWSVLGPSALGG